LINENAKVLAPGLAPLQKPFITFWCKQEQPFEKRAEQIVAYVIFVIALVSKVQAA
jgi:hypothetical protein